MKWNVILGTMVLGVALCAQQSYGFELLDRMLGVGAAQKGGKCGCDAAQKGGCKDGACQKGDGKGCGNGACQKDGGKDDACQKGGHSLFGGRGACQKGDGKGCGNDACQKDGGKDDACQKGSKGGRGSLLDRIFACNKCCDSGKGGKGDACQKGDGKGCGAACQKGGADQKSDGKAVAPMPPAPVVDPSAYLNAQRSVVQVSVTR